MLYPVNLIVSIALALLLLLGGFGRESEADYVARSLDIDLPEPLSVTYGDSHGGFHGDGLLHIELTFDLEDRAAVEEEAAEASPFPTPRSRPASMSTAPSPYLPNLPPRATL